MDQQTAYAKFLGISGKWGQSIRLHRSRKLEEHERQRLRHFRQGRQDRAFLVRNANFGGRGPWRNAGEWQLDLYVALAEPGLERSLSHERTHAMLHVRATHSQFTPSWFDEGLAVYLELSPDAGGDFVPGTNRTDLLEVLAVGREQDLLFDFVAMTNTRHQDYTGTTARLRYAQAWSMVHFLAEGFGRDSMKLLGRYIDLLNSRNRTPQAAFEEVYGEDYGKHDEAWRMHLEALR